MTLNILKKISHLFKRETFQYTAKKKLAKRSIVLAKIAVICQLNRLMTAMTS